MSVSNDSMALSTIDDGGALLSSTFIDLYNNDHSVMPELGKHFKIRHSCEREGIELADATWKKHCLDWRRKIYEKLCRERRYAEQAQAMRVRVAAIRPRRDSRSSECPRSDARPRKDGQRCRRHSCTTYRRDRI
jgi:hypothetical protein